MSALSRVLRGAGAVSRSGDPLGLDQWMNYFSFNGINYPIGFGSGNQTLGQKSNEVDKSFAGYANGLYRANGVVFACIGARQRLFTEARFQHRQIQNGRPGDLFGTPALLPLEEPWPNGTTGDLLGRALQDADICGNFFALRPGRLVQPSTGRIVDPGEPRLTRMRPDWVTVIAGSQDGSPEMAEVVGYAFTPGGIGSGNDPIFYDVAQVAHWTPTPDPMANWLGISWLTPVLTEIMADGAAMTHKLKFFENGATSNMLVTFDPSVQQQQFDRWISKFNQRHEGIRNAYKTMFLGGGADAKIIGSDMKQIDFTAVQGHGETRIASAAGVPPIIMGLSEGLAAATYSNYGQARRAFADGTMRPLWRGFCAAMGTVIDSPGSSELWYDDRDIAFLREDERDAADIENVKAGTIHLLVSAGFTPESVIAAATAQDMTLLEHTGMFSVQLMPAGKITEGKGSVLGGTAVPNNPATNGKTGQPGQNTGATNNNTSNANPASQGTNDDSGRALLLSALQASQTRRRTRDEK